MHEFTVLSEVPECTGGHVVCLQTKNNLGEEKHHRGTLSGRLAKILNHLYKEIYSNLQVTFLF